MKTHKEVLEELHDKTLAFVVDSEITIAYLKTQDPKRVLKEKPRVFAGQMMKEDITVEMSLKEQEVRLKENQALLEVIDKAIAEEK